MWLFTSHEPITIYIEFFLDSVMIAVRDLCFQYTADTPQVLSHIGLTVRKGDYLAVLGPSGSGKSTLCLTFNGVIPHSIPGKMSGDVVVNTLNTKDHLVYELADTVGIVLQNPESQLFAMSVEEELAFGPENMGLSRTEIITRVEDALSIIGIPDKERFPFSLSGGEKQKLAIASMLTMNPSYLVLDEPTSQLDPQGKRGVFSVLQKLYTQGMSIVLIEHDTEHVAEHAQSVVILKDGKIVRAGSPKEVFSEVEEMKELGVQVPEVAEFTYELAKRGLVDEVCITLEEIKKMKGLKAGKKVTSKTVPEPVVNDTSSEPAVIEVKALSFQYTDTPVLTDVNLSIYSGESVALIGQNGSGKTTLVKHFNGLLRPLQGEIHVKGESIKGKSVAEMARTVGYVFQNPDHQIFADTVFDEVEFGLKNLEVPEEERNQRVTQVLKQTDLYKYEKTHPTSLSGGEKQRLAIASVLVMDPEILILDEPTTGLDLQSSRSIINLVKSLHQKQHTVILVTHDMRLVAEMAGRIIILKDGTVAADANPHTIFADHALLKENFLEEPQITKVSQLLGYGTCLTVSELLHTMGVVE
jgi:energy-coupling factor transport system ATP-binding protein